MMGFNDRLYGGGFFKGNGKKKLKKSNAYCIFSYYYYSKQLVYKLLIGNIFIRMNQIILG